MIVFENRGEIDPRAAVTFGVNVKDGDSPIGFFGTGMKYAIAILLRAGASFVVQSGLTVHQFTAVKSTIRGKDFDIVHMDGVPCGFTTDVGKNWEMWMAYRELFCNARDEGGHASEDKEAPDPREDWTRVIVDGCDAFDEAHRTSESFLLFDRDPIAVIPRVVEVYSGSSSSAFYRGVRVGNCRGSRYTYNALRQMNLTEDRTMMYSFQFLDAVRSAVAKSTDARFIEYAVTQKKDSLESEIDYNAHTGGFSDKFDEVVAVLIEERPLDVVLSAKESYRKRNEKVDIFITRDRTAIEDKVITRATAFCKKIGFSVDDYVCKIVDELGGNALATVHRPDVTEPYTIYLSTKCMQKGCKVVAAALIEEWVHAKHDFDDYTFEMQDFLFERMVSIGEEFAFGEPL